MCGDGSGSSSARLLYIGSMRLLGRSERRCSQSWTSSIDVGFAPVFGRCQTRFFVCGPCV